MAKTIRLEDDVYNYLLDFMLKGETQGQGVQRALKIARAVQNIQARGKLGTDGSAMQQDEEPKYESAG
jgi:hypothetical protein